MRAATILIIFIVLFVCQTLAQWQSLTNETQIPYYGTPGHPGTRYLPITFVDRDPRYIWLGYGQQSVNSFYEDLWLYDTQTTIFAYISGATGATSTPSNTLARPIARNAANVWVDSKGDVWVFGGTFGLPVSYMGDLWHLRIDNRTTTWTWVQGGDPLNATANVYSVIDSPNAHPGSRSSSVTWLDSEDNLFMFGGYGIGDQLSSIRSGYCNDIWMFNTTERQWSFIGGSTSSYLPYVTYNYGTQGVPDISNWPMGRTQASSWFTGETLYVFGGLATDTMYINDLWKYENDTWTWIGGLEAVYPNSSIGALGTFGIESNASLISGRAMAIPYFRDNKLYLYEGKGVNITSQESGVELGDIWYFDMETGLWAWISPFPDSIVTKPAARYGTGNVIIGDLLYMYAGTAQTIYFSDMWSFNMSAPISNVTEIIEEMVPIKSENSSEGTSGGIIAAIVVPIVVVLCVGIFLGIFFYRKNKSTQKSNEETPAVSVELSTVVLPENEKMEGITIDSLIGSGSFGEVYRGSWHNTPVALKKMKPQYFSQFKKELSTLMSLKHPQIVQYLGIYVNNNDSFIVMELMNSGDISTLLKTAELMDEDLLSIAVQCAGGLTYLHDNNIIHRDVALRNFLASKTMNGKIVAKLSDFGMATLLSDTYYESENKVLPYKWASVEVLKFGKYSTASDVWAFGITLWEIYSQGAQPYFGKTNSETSDFVLAGNRLERPSKCPETIYSLMLRCWAEKTKERPTMRMVNESLHKMLSKDERDIEEQNQGSSIYGLTSDSTNDYQTLKHSGLYQ